MLQDVLSDGVHQVRLAQSDPAVDEERVVRSRRRFGDGSTRGVRKLVRRSDDEGVEGVAKIQTAGAGRRRRRWAGREGFVGAQRNRRAVRR